MTFSLKNKLLGHEFIGIEVFDYNSENYYAYAHYKLKNEELSIVENEIFIPQNNSLNKINSNTPICLSINTNQVLYKIIDKNEVNDEQALNKAFPSIKLDDFYYEIHRWEDTYYVAICRKSYLNYFIDIFQEQKKDLISITLGLGHLKNIFPFIMGTSEFYTNNRIIKFNPTQNVEILTTSKNHEVKHYNINNLEINNQIILSFCHVLSVIANSKAELASTDEMNEIIYDNFIQKQFSKKLTKYSLIVFIGVLLVNFLVFNYYFKETEHNKTLLSSYEIQLNEINTLKGKINDKQKKVNDFIHTQSSINTYRVNEINKLIPHGISLNEINYCPVEKFKENQTPIFEENTIYYNGTTKNNNLLSEWIEKIESLNWVNKTTIISFGNSSFSIKIEIDHHETK